MIGYIRMYNDRLVDVFNPQPEDIIPVNFLHALSCINRFTGAAPFPISVGQHTLELHRYMRNNHPHLAKAALLHDWSEALFNDIATPVKKGMVTYKKHEHNAVKVIFDRFGVPLEYDLEHKQYDKRIYMDEVLSTWGEMLKGPYAVWERDLTPLGITFHEMYWYDVRKALIAVFREEFPEDDIYGHG